MALTEYDILIPGNYFCDLIFTGFPQFPALGTEVYTEELTVTVGGVLNTVIAMQRLGVNVGWLGQVGNDFFSRFVLETIEKEGVDTALIRRVNNPYQRVTVSVSYPQDRAFITYVDPATTSVEMTLEALDTLNFRHLHFTGLQLDPRTTELLRLVKARGATISMDCQHRPVTLESELVREILSQLTLFMPNTSEAKRLTGYDALPQAVNALREFVPNVIVKDGANGAFAWVNDQSLYAPAIQVNCIDTTGAGDVFNAGFLSAYLEGRSIEDCLKWGNICGGLSTLGRGGTSTAPTRAEVEQRLR